MLMTERESELLRNLLHHGGVATSGLVAQFLSISIQEARLLAKSLVDRGWLVLTPLKILRGNTLYYQVSRRSARYFGIPNAAAARYTRRDESCLQGLVRFWFRSTYNYQFKTGIEDITECFDRKQMNGPITEHGYISETIIEDSDGVYAYAFPALDHVLSNFVKSTIIKYSSQIQKIKIGFVIDSRRMNQLENILDMVMESTSHSICDAEIISLKEKIMRAESEMERVQLERRLNKINSDFGLMPNFLSKTIVHDLF